MTTRIPLDTAAALSAAALGRALAHGAVDARELADFLQGRIEAYPDKAVFLTVTAERARREADAARRRLAEGRPASPLDGVPIAWKDLVDLAGTRTTAASSLRREVAPAARDARVAANAAAAGMVTLGKTNLTEFAYSGLGLNPHFGARGSSSGSAVAVAAGLVPCAIGSDTGGSVRVPAAFNGIVGYKSSERRIPVDGVFPLSPTLDTVGPLARSVEDCVLLDMVLRGAVTTGVRRVPLSEVRIVVPETVVLDDLEPAVARNFERAVDALARAGAAVTAMPLPAFERIAEISDEHGTLTAAEAYDIHHAIVDGPDRAKVDERVVDRILRGKSMTARDVLVIRRERRRLAQEVAETLAGAILAMPTTAHVAPEIAPLEADKALFHRVNLKTLRNTILGNFLNHCGVALPSGADSAGLPTGILLAAPGGEDERLLSAALSAEVAIGAAVPEATPGVTAA